MKGNTMTDFKPGDVAMVALRDFDACRAIRTPNGWVDSDGVDISDYSPVTAHRLVVIDPESAEDMGRLSDIWYATTSADLEDDMQLPVDGWRLRNVLREFASPTPPKPADPRALGAVVEDTEGRRWVCFHSQNTRWWWRTSTGENRRWADINVAAILSEGVS